jgi:type 1 glutamine amidotransferase
LIIHYANGAWHFSLPGAEDSDWPEYRKICRRVWDHKGGSAHDPYDTFTVNIQTPDHYITRGLSDFETTDELYYNQAGTEQVEPLITARSRDTGKDEPLAWVYNYGKGRIYQTLLGHDAASLTTPEVQEMLKRAAVWVSFEE